MIPTASSRASVVLACLLVAACGSRATANRQEDAGVDQSPAPDSGSPPAAMTAPPDAGIAASDASTGPAPGQGLPMAPNLPAAIYPPVAYTAYDGVHTFRVPLTTGLPGNFPRWAITDPSIASIATVPGPVINVGSGAAKNFGRNWAMVTALHAGNTTVTLTVPDITATASVVVTSYTPQQYGVGDKRYNNPDNPSGPARAACASCHQKPDGADHSPLVLGASSADTIVQVITTGKFPDGTPLVGVDHQMNLTADEQVGIIAYLRGLPPKGF